MSTPNLLAVLAVFCTVFGLVSDNESLVLTGVIVSCTSLVITEIRGNRQ